MLGRGGGGRFPGYFIAVFAKVNFFINSVLI